MDRWEYHKPTVALLAMQFVYAGAAIITRAALVEEMSPMVYVVYRQALATLIMAPIAYISSRKKVSNVGIGVKSLSLMFIASLFGVTINQNLFFEGMYLTSASVTSAMSNLLPAITFLMAASVGLEKLELKSTRSMAKVIGTIICVMGAISMALLKGPKLLNMGISRAGPLFFSASDNWTLGCLLLFASTCCRAFLILLQVPMSVCYPHYASLSAWMCFFATIQSAILGYYLEPSPSAWKLSSSYKVFCCVYAGIVSGSSVYVQTWCISKRGPLFSAMFSPLCTVIVTLLACLLLHEKFYIGSLLGAAAIVIGLYVVLWGKAVEFDKKKSNIEDMEKECHDIEEPLLRSDRDIRVNGEPACSPDLM